MIFACGLSSYDVGVFHLFNHAFFKALLFLGAGSVIHSISNEQDMRKMGGLKQILPFSYAITVIGSLALTGFPFLSGFYSKDIILEVAFAKYTNLSFLSYVLGTSAAFFTAFYSMRLIALVFLTTPNGTRFLLTNAHESSWRMFIPLFILACLSIVVGYFSKDLLIGVGTDFWGSSIYILPLNYTLCDIEFISFFFKFLPLFFTLLGFLLAILIYKFNLNYYFKLKQSKLYKIIYTFFNKKWYFDRIYNEIITQNLLFYSFHFSYKDIDRGILEIFGPYYISKNVEKTFKNIQIFQSGNVLDYLFFFLMSIIFIIGFIIYIF
jgi:NADH-ubiquinone oxidoreductase chain 5